MKLPAKHFRLPSLFIPVFLLFAYAGNASADADKVDSTLKNTDEAEIIPVILSTLLSGTPTTLYRDADADTFGDPSASVLAEAPLFGYVENNADCDDTSSNTNPNAIEILDGKDNNCDGQIDEGLGTTYYHDADSDGYGNPDIPVTATSQPAGYVLDGTDCDDTTASTYPGAPEIPGDMIDNNCNGVIDEPI